MFLFHLTLDKWIPWALKDWVDYARHESVMMNVMPDNLWRDFRFIIVQDVHSTIQSQQVKHCKLLFSRSDNYNWVFSKIGNVTKVSKNWECKKDMNLTIISEISPSLLRQRPSLSSSVHSFSLFSGHGGWSVEPQGQEDWEQDNSVWEGFFFPESIYLMPKATKSWAQ